MVLLEEQKQRLVALKPQLEELGDALGLQEAQKRVEELEIKTAQPGFWDNPEKSQVIVKEMGDLKEKIEGYHKLCADYEDAETMVELAAEENDEEMLQELSDAVDEIERQIAEKKLATLLTGEYDDSNAIVTIHPGAGGTESQDWASMLYRMYTRYATQHGFTVQLLDYLDGDEAGIKSVSFMVKGKNAYGFLKGEHGVHRLVRVSPFDSAGRRHTSFSSVEVVPELPEDVDVEIRPEDIKMDVFRASGAGGQHVNKTSSAVRLTHLPTGIVVSCQNERSQFQNKDMCMKMLKAKLVQIKIQQHYDRIEDIKGEQKDIAWGSQIRSYVFMPYTLVKDTRTGAETANVNGVMDGDLDLFINAYLTDLSLGKLEN